MLSLEERINRVWYPEVRPLVADAYRCHSTGTPRAAIVATWTAVCADIIHKLYQLAEDGDGKATAITAKLDEARGKLDTEAIKIVEDLEKKILEHALELELIDGIEHRQLLRLKQDRNLCAHPSLHALGDVFAPTGDYARAHLVTALDALLVHPPTQGRKVFERYIAHVSDPSFVGNADYLVQMFAQRVKSSSWKLIVGIAAKHAMLDLPVPEDSGITASVAADRHALCLVAFAQHDREAAQKAVVKAMPAFNGLPIEQQVKVLGRLGSFEVFADALDASVCEQIGTYVERGSTLPANNASWSLAPGLTPLYSLVGVEALRGRIPALAVKFTSLHPLQQAHIIEGRPCDYFTDFLAGILTSAGSFRSAESLTKAAVIPCARLIKPDQLSPILTAWASNLECREAGGMPELAVELWERATALQSHPAWTVFVAEVQAVAASEWYEYKDLAARIGWKGAAGTA
ncbi:hypothetical protein [Kitasatospora sp. NBC_01300]|uniref:hypothetical protein n=1 Tax=Kitasatospora sp. NBC_01300 TaxID=2903574 RepID=UPI00352C244E|nr:hypothetical protein OG556_39890 [Kitasatospora sp. NBC_01300]